MGLRDSASVRTPLRGFELELGLAREPGAPVALVGRSGSGKTSMLRAIAGLLSPAAGTVESAGRGLARHRARHRPGAGAARLRLPLPGLRALPADERLAQRRLRDARAAARAPGGDAGGARALRRGGARRGAPGDDVGGRAPARGAGPGAGGAAAGAAARRAALGARLDHPARGDRRAAGRLRRGRHARRPRHPLLRGGGGAGGRAGRDRRRAGDPAGHRRGDLGLPRLGLRRRLLGRGGAARRGERRTAT